MQLLYGVFHRPWRSAVIMAQSYARKVAIRLKRKWCGEVAAAKSLPPLHYCAVPRRMMGLGKDLRANQTVWPKERKLIQSVRPDSGQILLNRRTQERRFLKEQCHLIDRDFGQTFRDRQMSRKLITKLVHYLIVGILLLSRWFSWALLWRSKEGWPALVGNWNLQSP